MISLNAASMSDPGITRDLNEDRVWSQVCTSSEGKLSALLIVCDGMGGYLGGEHASYWAVEAIKQSLSNYFVQKDPRATVHLSAAELEASLSTDPSTAKGIGDKAEAEVLVAIEKANQVVYEYARQKPKKAANAGTTVTLAFIQGNLALIANVGDSRTYLLREHQLRQVTIDHSLVAELVASGQIKPEEIYTHPQRNVIFRALGQKQRIQVDVFRVILEPGDILLLCSDGLWEMVQDEKLIVRLIEKAEDPKQACLNLIDAANAAGGEDNISAVVAKAIQI
jgi:serine/threonine protein phosphatase PrpC